MSRFRVDPADFAGNARHKAYLKAHLEPLGLFDDGLSTAIMDACIENGWGFHVEGKVQADVGLEISVDFSESWNAEMAACELVVRKDYKMPAHFFNGKVDTRELEGVFAGIDWEQVQLPADFLDREGTEPSVVRQALVDFLELGDHAFELLGEQGLKLAEEMQAYLLATYGAGNGLENYLVDKYPAWKEVCTANYPFPEGFSFRLPMAKTIALDGLEALSILFAPVPIRDGMVRFKERDFLETSALLNEAQMDGYRFLAMPLERAYWTEDDFKIFFHKDDARECAAVNGAWRVVDLADFVMVMNAAEDCGLAPVVDLGPQLAAGRVNYLSVNDKSEKMNLNNLSNLQQEMRELGFSDKLSEQMEAMMQTGQSEFMLYDSLPATKGRVDLALSFRKSSQSEFYYLNKYRVVHEKGAGLKAGDKLMVVSAKEGADELVKQEFVQLADAVKFMAVQKELQKEEKGTAVLLVGKDEQSAAKLVSLTNGKVDYLQPEFKEVYREARPDQTFYVDHGKGFTAEQAANLIQGRAVLRDDMVSQKGQQYSAWHKLDFDVAKDRFGNYPFNQYSDPAYGFDLSRVLDKFDIKELGDPAKREVLERALKEGNRAEVTVEQDGKAVKLGIEAVPRYSQINLFDKDGKTQKREQFLKEPDIKQEYAQSRERSRSRDKGQEVSL